MTEKRTKRLPGRSLEGSSWYDLEEKGDVRIYGKGKTVA